MKTDYIKENGIYQLRDGIGIPQGKVFLLLQDIHTGKIEEELVKNVFLTAGKNSIAAHLMGDTSNMRGIITYCALGTGASTPAVGDTAMVTELIRKLISVPSVAENVATFQTFFQTTEANGTLTEAGLFGDNATATPGSGTMYAHTTISKVKTSSQTLTVYWSVTIP